MVNVNLISLGCSKNLVDSEVMLGLIDKAGRYKITEDPSSAEVVIVNTCGFIGSAREESVRTIESVSRLRKKGKLKALIVTGCFPKVRREELAGDPRAGYAAGVDAFLGPGDFTKINDVIESFLNEGRSGKPRVAIAENPAYVYDHEVPRRLTTPSHSAFVKIAEGCSNRCSYCLIPSIRGSFRSRKIESIEEEARRLAHGGVREINLIAQDTTNYGSDIYGKREVSRLLERLAGIDGIKWIRLLYAHPAHFDRELIAAVRDIPKVCRYVDLPVQHIDDELLSRTGRKADSSQIRRLIESLRSEIRNLTLRTSVIVGLPGETDKKFKSLLDFIRETRFERLGAFKYSREPGTPAHDMEGQVSEDVKEARFDEVMRTQQAISRENNERLIGAAVEVLIDKKIKEGRFSGRTEGDAPDVDCSVIVRGKCVKPGDFVKVKIDKAYEYDLEGKIV